MTPPGDKMPAAENEWEEADTVLRCPDCSSANCGGDCITPRPDEDDDYDDGEDEGRECFWCSGDGWDECDDPIQCCNEHSPGGLCRCTSCGGSGLAKDMTVW